MWARTRWHSNRPAFGDDYSFAVAICGHCGEKGVDVDHVRQCSKQEASLHRNGSTAARRAELEQIREHGLAGAGLSKAPRDKAAFADSLRQQQTAAERKLGSAMFRSKLVRFKAQVPLNGYIVDFYFENARLAIEVDGTVHQGRATADRLRDDTLAAAGILVLRFSNSQVDRQLGKVIGEIKRTLASRGNRARNTGSAELDWLLYRYGPEALGLSSNNGAGRVGPSSGAKQRPSSGGNARSAPEARRATSTVKRKFACLGCRRSFVDYPEPTPSCQRCGPQGKVLPVCRRCEKAVPRIFEDTWVCDICTDAHSVAVTAAGSGETPTGPLHNRQSRAKHLRLDGR